MLQKVLPRTEGFQPSYLESWGLKRKIPLHLQKKYGMIFHYIILLPILPKIASLYFKFIQIIH